MTYRAKPIAVLLALLALFLAPFATAQDAPHIGLKIRTLTAELRKQNHLGDDVKGALVTAVEPGSPAQEKGINAGDVIIEASGKPVTNAKAVAERIAAAAASGAGDLSLKVITGHGEHRDVTVSIAKKPAASSPMLPAPK